MCEHIFLQHLSANLMIFGCLDPPGSPISKTYLTRWATLYPYAPGKYMLRVYPHLCSRHPKFMLTTPQIYAHRKPYMLNEQILMLATIPTVMLTQKQCMLRLPSRRPLAWLQGALQEAHGGPQQGSRRAPGGRQERHRRVPGEP